MATKSDVWYRTVAIYSSLQQLMDVNLKTERRKEVATARPAFDAEVWSPFREVISLVLKKNLCLDCRVLQGIHDAKKQPTMRG